MWSENNGIKMLDSEGLGAVGHLQRPKSGSSEFSLRDQESATITVAGWKENRRIFVSFMLEPCCLTTEIGTYKAEYADTD